MITIGEKLGRLQTLVLEILPEHFQIVEHMMEQIEADAVQPTPKYNRFIDFLNAVGLNARTSSFMMVLNAYRGDVTDVYCYNFK